MNFKYGKKEMEYLKSRDRRLGEVIDSIGRIRWTVEPDLFSAIVQNIVSQQVFRTCGASLRKTEYIKDLAAKVISGDLDLAAVASRLAAARRASTSGWSPAAQSPN